MKVLGVTCGAKGNKFKSFYDLPQFRSYFCNFLYKVLQYIYVFNKKLQVFTLFMSNRYIKKIVTIYF